MARYREPVPLRPAPADPLVCHWCASRMVRTSIGEAVCPRQCFTKPIVGGTCEDCGREFSTGKKGTANLCWQCEQREHDALVAAYAGPTPGRYDAEQLAKGANRRAVAALNGAAPEPVDVSSTTEKTTILDEHLRERQRERR